MVQCTCCTPNTIKYYYISEVTFMKKRLIAYLLVSALAVAVFAGCGKKGEGDGADAAATGSTAVAEEAAAADTAAAEVAAVADTAAEIADVAGTSDAAEVADIAVTGDEAVAEVVDEKEVEEAEDAKTEEGDYLVVEPGTVYTVRYGGNVYSSPEENAANIMYSANPGDMLNVVERLDNYWYKVTYYISGEGVEHTGYIQIQ